MAIRILCSLQLQEFIDYAQDLLQHFVSSFMLLYGAHNVSHNIHGLIHLVQDVKKFDTVDSFSSFKYENYLQTLKRLLKKHDKPLQQIVRRCIEYEKNKIHETEIYDIRSSQFVIDLKSTHIEGPLIESCCNPQYKILRNLNATIRINTLADTPQKQHVKSTFLPRG